MSANTIGKYRWTICALLFFATTINYLDRQVLSLLQPTLAETYGWTNVDYANITSVFQFVYAISMLFAGRIIDRLGTKKGYVWAIIIWSLAAIMHAFAIPIGQATATVLGLFGIGAVSVSIAGFMVSRAVLGFGEAGNFPAAIKATAEYFPKKERSFATGIFNSGTNVGAILAPMSVPYIASHWGWQTAFVIIGAVGFLWLIFWWMYYEKPENQKRLSKEEYEYIHSDKEEESVGAQEKVSWVKLLGYRQTWAFAFGKFMTDGVWWFFLFWLPAYLKAQYDMEKTEISLPLAVLYTMAMVGSIGGGWFPVYFLRKGYAPYDGRMRAMFLIALIPLVVLLAQPLGGISFWIPVVLIGIGASAHQAWSANIFTTVSDMFPKKAVASVVGIGGMAGGLGGVMVSKVAGALFDHYKALGHIQTGYTIMFAACAVAYVIAWVVMKSLVPKYKLITDL
ncbi:MFS transporter [Haliscomenobacter hydrossis]|uniref:Major facilitator superfamily MFS_1 n=1 Tax=Haliscomenobacter hydrossis (strain ATCC 27775 / DSM 1100 / LMG 10767 / O) TaxID=760192 RepID=F4KQW2_HALH1|nr:MFS transporter [Haliscomenobacter hydrossis]AEE52247.1 major facilitator superfamily MFS_1 [Haliscomenobacter hydrossis DSM 1100]